MFGSKKMEAKKFQDRRCKTKNKTKIFSQGGHFFGGFPPPINNEPSLNVRGKKIGLKKFWVKKIIGEKTVGSKKFLCDGKKYLIRKNYLGQINIWVNKGNKQKILGQKCF